ncbi:MAG TPA: phosphoglucomutase/phosphomannomutase family protein, partial [Methylomirabilota bacterium]|nr:phosphoglucomutase/phosphomannomutase family protein [Methylomirabilota bacterium]
MTTPIRFGTDGWRGIIGEDFTEENAARVVQAAAEVWAAETGGTGCPLVVGYDTRRLSREVAKLAAGILAANGWAVLLADRPVPTPLVSFTVVDRAAAGGLVVTASHNPARFNGIKLKAAFGGSAAPELTARV